MKKIIAVFALAFSVLVSFHPAEAQAGKMRRIGYLTVRSKSRSASLMKIFRKGLRGLGYEEGKNILIEERYAAAKRARIPEFAKELIRRNVELIVTHGGYSTRVADRAVKRAGRTIPIVMAEASDAVGRGIVKSLARPGGNITGLTSINSEMGAKRLELLKEVVPGLTRVAVLWNPYGPGSRYGWKTIQAPAQRLGLQLHSMGAPNLKNLDKVFEDAARARAGALILTSGATLARNRHRILALVAKHRLTAIYASDDFVKAGGLMSYTRDVNEMYLRVPAFVDKILKGAKPADLPVEQPRKFDLIINLKAARAIGLTIPPELLLRATKVIK